MDNQQEAAYSQQSNLLQRSNNAETEANAIGIWQRPTDYAGEQYVKVWSKEATGKREGWHLVKFTETKGDVYETWEMLPKRKIPNMHMVHQTMNTNSGSFNSKALQHTRRDRHGGQQ